MRSLLVVFLVTFSTVAFGQGMKIKWEDKEGREFSISAPTGDFSYGMIQGDNISYDAYGRVNKVGSVFISYDAYGRVNKVGTVFITYDAYKRVNKVGGLFVTYDAYGRISGTSGSVIQKSYY